MLRRPVVTTGNSFWGRVALKLDVTKLVCVKLAIRRKFMSICASGEKLLQEATGMYRGQVYPVAKNLKDIY